MINFKVFRSDLSSEEFLAHSYVALQWSQAKPWDYRDKLKVLRQAVTACIGSGGPETVPHELVRADYKAVLEAVRWAKQEVGKRGARGTPVGTCLRNCWVSYSFSATPDGLIKRPLPVPPAFLQDIENAFFGKPSASGTAMKITAARLGIRSGTAAKLAYRMPQRTQLSRLQGLAISVFLDLCGADCDTSSRWRKGLLEALEISMRGAKDWGLVLFYMVILGHNTNRPLALRAVPVDQIEKLCKLLRTTKN